MRIFVTGASGFVGSNLVHVFRDRHGADVVAPGHEHVDLTDAALVTRAVAASRPDAIVHAAIWNAPAALERDRARAWAGYVGATRNVTTPPTRPGSRVVLVSTDWVFDGTQGPAAEGEPPNPINAYGFLKAASELVVTERAGHGVVARIAARPGRPPRPRRRRRARRTPASATSSPRSSTRCAPASASPSGTARASTRSPRRRSRPTPAS